MVTESGGAFVLSKFIRPCLSRSWSEHFTHVLPIELFIVLWCYPAAIILFRQQNLIKPSLAHVSTVFSVTLKGNRYDVLTSTLLRTVTFSVNASLFCVLVLCHAK